MYDNKLTDLRRNIFKDDLALDPALIHVDNNHHWWITNYCEDAFKYCDRKWYAVEFDVIEAAVENDKIVSMSGAKIYQTTAGKKFLRVNMFYYTLKKHRKDYNGVIYINGGFDDRHIEYARQHNCEGMFFTIYTYSSKLKALAINHSKRRISHKRSELKHLDNIVHVGSELFNNVEQEFFYYPLTSTSFNPKDIT